MTLLLVFFGSKQLQKVNLAQFSYNSNFKVSFKTGTLTHRYIIPQNANRRGGGKIGINFNL